MNQGVIIVIDRCEILKSFFEYADYETLLTDPLKTKAILLDLKMPSKDVSLINGIVASNPNLFRIRIFRVKDRNKIEINTIVDELVKDSYFTRESIEQFVKDLVDILYPIVDKRDEPILSKKNLTFDLEKHVIDRLTEISKINIDYSENPDIPSKYMKKYRKAVLGDIYSQLFIADSFFIGDNGFKKSFSSALRWYRRIADDNGISISNLSFTDPNIPTFLSGEEMDIYKKALQGNSNEQWKVGCNYCYGKNGYPKSYPDALKWFKKSASQNNANSFANLGIMYGAGWGVEISYEVSADYYKKALSINPKMFVACSNLGNYYHTGRGVPQDYSKAKYYYEIGASLGDSYSMNGLGLLYESGHGVFQSYETAKDWYSKAAELGNMYAMCNLGFFYENGYGLSRRNMKKAVQLYRKSADMGYDRAQFLMGDAYALGKGGLPQSYEEALKWYELAAKKGNSSAFVNIGWLYENGFGVPKSYGKALEYYKKAAELGDSKGKRCYESLSKKQKNN